MSELNGVVAKMQCHNVESSKSQYSHQHKVKLGAVCSDTGENKDFADATPSGECWMNISNGRPALDFFEPGAEYYVTFTKAPKKS